ncbi:MAG TPA: flavin reductase [Ruminococcaceae bacterium]|nr:flavin reductase [Oscillospiraceae bacterium]
MKEIDLRELNLNPFKLIGNDWLVLAAGDESGCNAMTVSWGHLGCLWSPNRPTAAVYVRQSRYTKEFIDKHDLFTLSLIEDRAALGYLGSHSGRNENKFENAGIKPLFIDGTTAIEGAKLIFVCRKLYKAPISADCFIDKSIAAKDYANGDFHEMYIGEIIKTYD